MARLNEIKIVIEVGNTVVVACIGLETTGAYADTGSRTEIHSGKSLVEVRSAGSMVDAHVIAYVEIAAVAVQVVEIGAEETAEFQTDREAHGAKGTESTRFERIVVVVIGMLFCNFFRDEIYRTNSTAFARESNFLRNAELVVEFELEVAAYQRAETAGRGSEHVRLNGRIIAADSEAQTVTYLCGSCIRKCQSGEK